MSAPPMGMMMRIPSTSAIPVISQKSNCVWLSTRDVMKKTSCDTCGEDMPTPLIANSTAQIVQCEELTVTYYVKNKTQNKDVCVNCLVGLLSESKVQEVKDE